MNFLKGFAGQVAASPQFQQARMQLPQAYTSLPGGIAAQRGKLLSAIGTGREAALGHMQTGRQSLEELNTSREMLEEEIATTKKSLKNEASKSEEILTKQALWIVGKKVVQLAKEGADIVCPLGAESITPGALLKKVIDKLAADITVPRVIRTKLTFTDENRLYTQSESRLRQIVMIELERLQRELLAEGICKGNKYEQNNRVNAIKQKQQAEYAAKFFKQAVAKFSFANYESDPNTDRLVPVIPFSGTNTTGNFRSLFSGFSSYGGKRRKTHRSRSRRRRTTRKR